MRLQRWMTGLVVLMGLFGCSEEQVTKSTGEQRIEPPDLSFCVPEAPAPNPRSCIDEDKMAFYFDVWKAEFMDRNDIDEDYFDTHITLLWNNSICWNSGISFWVIYRITIDWVVIDRADKFVIMLYSSEDAYQHLNFPRDVFLDPYQVGRILDHRVFQSAVGPVIPLESLGYDSCLDAAEAFQDSTGSEDIWPVWVRYYVPGKVPREDGYPYFIGHGEVDRENNECITGYFNLFTGEHHSYPTHCVVE